MSVGFQCASCGKWHDELPLDVGYAEPMYVAELDDSERAEFVTMLRDFRVLRRDRNRIALQSDLISAAASGVRNLLMLRGDDPSAGDQPDAKAVFDLDARALLETARRLRDEGELPSGRKIAGVASFFLGAADSPIDPPALETFP